MAESKVIVTNVNRPNSASPPPNCAICLGSFSNKCFSDSCMHQFCFMCLLKWSKIKAECPLCKQPFRRIIHNVKSNEEYDEHVVETTPLEEIHIIDNEEFLFLPLGGNPQPPPRHHFHFRTTFTVDTRGEHAIQQMLLSHPLMGNGGQVSVGGYPPRNIFQRRRRDNTSTSFRRSIYNRNLWVTAPPDVTGRYRDVSPTFFRDCPGARARLVPWLNRELNALLYENTQLVMHLVDLILDHLLRHHICSRTFRNLLYEYLDNKTDHFIHEFYNFMRSPYDMIGYDRNVIYTERPQSPLPHVVELEDDISDSNNSDVIIIGATNSLEPVIIDLVNTDSDEPILIAREDLPRPIVDRCSPVQETRPPVLPLKLRLKHKHRHLNKERETVQKQKKKSRHHRSRSSSSSSSSSSTSESSKMSYKRYKRRKKMKKLMKKRTRSSSTESNVNVDDTSSDSDVPLSAIAGKKKKMKKYKKTLNHLFKNPKQEKISVSTNTKDNYNDNLERLPSVLASSNLPSCSRYNSDSSAVVSSSQIENGLDLRTHNRQNENSSGLVNAPTCSKYTYSSNRSSPDGTSSFNLNTKDSSSSEDDYPLNHLIKSEFNGYMECGAGSSKSSGTQKRLRNICIKKEEATNMWYSYPSNYSSDSSSN